MGPLKQCSCLKKKKYFFFCATAHVTVHNQSFNPQQLFVQCMHTAMRFASKIANANEHTLHPLIQMWSLLTNKDIATDLTWYII